MAAPGDDAAAPFRERIAEFNRYHRAATTAWDHVREAPAIFRHLVRWFLASPFGMLRILAVRLVVVALSFVLAIAYMVLPVDLIPEAALGVLGLVDDVLVIACALVAFSTLLRARG